jgi:hypothetical protein
MSASIKDLELLTVTSDIDYIHETDVYRCRLCDQIVKRGLFNIGEHLIECDGPRKTDLLQQCDRM